MGHTVDLGDERVSAGTLSLLAASFPALCFLGTMPFALDEVHVHLPFPLTLGTDAHAQAADFARHIPQFKHLCTLVLPSPASNSSSSEPSFDTLALMRVLRARRCAALALCAGAAPLANKCCYMWRAGAEMGSALRDHEEMWLAAGARMRTATT